MISLGKIIKTRSNKGEVVITPGAGFDLSHPLEGETVLLKSSRRQKERKVEYVREIGGNLVIKFADTDTIAEALKLVGYTIYVSRTSNDGTPGEGIVGFRVKDVHGQWWGEIVNIAAGRLNAVLEIQDENRDELYYVPYDDAIVKEIDEQERTVLIDPPEGLRELNE